MLKRVLIAMSFASVITLAAPCHAADQWIEIKSPHFTVVSNAGVSPARNLAWQMEQIRSALATIWPWAHLDLDRPFIVLGAKDEASMKALAPYYWEAKGSVHPTSVWVEGADRYYLAVRTDVKGEDYRNLNPYLTSYFSYVSLILSQSVPKPLPLWLHRGLAGVLSNTVTSDQQVQVGPPIPDYLRSIREGPRFRLAELVTMTARSPAFRGDDMYRFDAQSWGLVHMLWFGDKGAHAANLEHFIDAVVAGGDPDKAFRESLGTPEALEGPLNVYTSRNIFGFKDLQVDVSVKRDAFPSRPLTTPESASLRALFHCAMNRLPDARVAIDEARKAGPAPESYVAEGRLLDRGGKFDEAQAAYQHAVDEGTTSPFAYRRLAGLLWRHPPSHDDLTQIAKLLSKAIELNNRDDYAYAMLGEARSELGEHDGMGFVRRSISLAPQRAEHHLSAARVLARERNFDGADKEVQAALALAQSDEERQRVREFTQWLEAARGRGVS